MPAEVAASPVTSGKRQRPHPVPARITWPFRCNHVTVMTLFDALISSKDDRAMAPRPSVTKHPFTLMLVVIALLAPFVGLAWRTREWMGW